MGKGGARVSSERQRRRYTDLRPLAVIREEAKHKAIDNLARYKFHNFGYWAAWWVKVNRLCPDPQPNPFKELVDTARKLRKVV